MSDCEIVVGKNGPLRVFGTFVLKDSDGKPFEIPQRADKNWVSLCRCGASKNKPFCDGTHKTISFESDPKGKQH
jgi:CDGSH-type Zn-finger protein